jgi:hypothetical protein
VPWDNAGPIWHEKPVNIEVTADIVLPQIGNYDGHDARLWAAADNIVMVRTFPKWEGAQGVGKFALRNIAIAGRNRPGVVGLRVGQLGGVPGAPVGAPVDDQTHGRWQLENVSLNGLERGLQIDTAQFGQMYGLHVEQCKVGIEMTAGKVGGGANSNVFYSPRMNENHVHMVVNQRGPYGQGDLHLDRPQFLSGHCFLALLGGGNEGWGPDVRVVGGGGEYLTGGNPDWDFKDRYGDTWKIPHTAFYLAPGTSLALESHDNACAQVKEYITLEDGARVNLTNYSGGGHTGVCIARAKGERAGVYFHGHGGRGLGYAQNVVKLPDTFLAPQFAGGDSTWWQSWYTGCFDVRSDPSMPNEAHPTLRAGATGYKFSGGATDGGLASHPILGSCRVVNFAGASTDAAPTQAQLDALTAPNTAWAWIRGGASWSGLSGTANAMMTLVGLFNPTAREQTIYVSSARGWSTNAQVRLAPGMYRWCLNLIARGGNGDTGLQFWTMDPLGGQVAVSAAMLVSADRAKSHIAAMSKLGTMFTRTAMGS